MATKASNTSSYGVIFAQTVPDYRKPMAKRAERAHGLAMPKSVNSLPHFDAGHTS
jgi:hypothetical protein